MKDKILTAVSTVMLFVPWSLILLRSLCDWAMHSPAAEILIYCYMALMVFSGVFTILSYFRAKIRNNLMKVCLVVNSCYMFFAAALAVIIIVQ